MATSRTPARESLWSLVPGPTIWAAHFLLSYVTGAIWCAKHAGPDGELDPVRAAVGLYTLVAVLLIAWSAHRGYRDIPAPAHELERADELDRFLRFAGFLLCVLAAIATLYTAMVVLFVRSCA